MNEIRHPEKNVGFAVFEIVHCDEYMVTFVEPGRCPSEAFYLKHQLGGETKTFYSGSYYWSGCGPVPDDEIHARELNITPARHRLEHDLWHHLVGIFIYKTLGSPIIWRDAHGIAQPPGVLRLGLDPDDKAAEMRWGPCEEEEWLVTALSHLYHNEHSRDHGASIWLANNGHNIGTMLQTARRILDQIPSD